MNLTQKRRYGTSEIESAPFAGTEEGTDYGRIARQIQALFPGNIQPAIFSIARQEIPYYSRILPLKKCLYHNKISAFKNYFFLFAMDTFSTFLTEFAVDVVVFLPLKSPGRLNDPMLVTAEVFG
ncbi:hypothetical protein ACQE32_13695 [Pantoea sp. FN0302]|uniref:hypothetical protein n=1 Tax=unclassified Pantoea TaxID=2630326 RepID=UPI003CF8DB45